MKQPTRSVSQRETRRYQRLYAEARRCGYRPDELTGKTEAELEAMLRPKSPRSVP